MSPRVKALLAFLRKLDWMDRAAYVRRLKVVNSDLAESVIDLLGPDELLCGRNGPVQIEGTLVLPDTRRGQKRGVQMSLEHYGIRKRR